MNQPLNYDVWKLRFRKDCEEQGILFASDTVGDFALRLLWEDGIDPTVAAVASNTGQPANIVEVNKSQAKFS